MQLSWLIIFKIAAFLIVALVAIGLFVKLTWIIRLKLLASLLAGIILIGLLPWPLITTPEQLPIVSLVSAKIRFTQAATLIILASLSGFIAYFLSWPQGREIGILAVPSGLAVWALHTTSMANLIQLHPTLAQQQTLFATLTWEPLFWLAVVAAGFAGVLSAQKIKSSPEIHKTPQNPRLHPKKYLNVIIGLAISVLIAQFFIGLFARDVRIADPKLGSVIGQPAIGQIAFAVLLAFALAAFAVKTLLNISYIWPIIASALITAFTITIYLKQDTLQYLTSHYPPTFFSHAVISILPVQMVAFGTLGSIAGYWLAIRYHHWKKREN